MVRQVEVRNTYIYINLILFELFLGAYTIEDLGDFKWTKIGTAFMLFYHFVLLSPLSIVSASAGDKYLY